MLTEKDLKGVPLFAGMSDKELKPVARQLREVNHAEGTEIMVRGDQGVGFMIILDGEVEIQLPKQRTRRLGPGEHFGEMALLDHEGRSATVVAKTPLRVAAVGEWNFKPFLSEHPEVAYRLLQTMSRRLRDVELR